MSAAVFAFDMPAVKHELISILTQLINERHFELLVKFSLHQFAYTFLDTKLDDGMTIREHLDREIFSDQDPRPAATTLEAYIAGQTLADLIHGPTSTP
jgi:hypothetical protein